MIRLGLSSQAFLTSATQAVIDFAREAGFEGIEWAGGAHVPTGDRAAAEALMMATLMAGLSVVSYAPPYRVCPEGESGLGFAAILEMASILQSPLVRVYAGSQPFGRLSAAGLERLRAELGRLGDLSGARGISLCLSLGKNTSLDGYAAAEAILSGLGHPYVGLAWEALPASSPREATAALGKEGGAVRLLLARSSGRDGSPSPLAAEAGEWARRLELYRASGPDQRLSRFVLLGRTGDGDEGRLRADLASLAAIRSRKA